MRIAHDGCNFLFFLCCCDLVAKIKALQTASKLYICIFKMCVFACVANRCIISFQCWALMSLCYSSTQNVLWHQFCSLYGLTNYTGMSHRWNKGSNKGWKKERKVGLNGIDIAALIWVVDMVLIHAATAAQLECNELCMLFINQHFLLHIL